MSDLKLYTRAALTPGVSDLFYLTRADGSADGTASFQTAAPVFAGVLAPFYAPLAHGHAAGVITGLAAVATSGDYADLTGRPTLGSLAALNAVNNGNWSGAALAIGNGGTGASDAAGARAALGLYSADETDDAIGDAIAALDSSAGLSVDPDPTLAANSDDLLATQKAVKAYADALLNANDAFQLKGVIDCSANPSYPTADGGHSYRISVAGKIGGAAGVSVEVGDMLMCLDDGTAAGNHATAGAHWTVWNVNIIGALTTADLGVAVQAYAANLAAFAGLSLVADRLPYANGAGTLALATFTAAARTFVAAVDAAAQRTAMGVYSTTQVDAKVRRVVQIQVTDPGGSALATGDGKAYFRVPSDFNGLNLVEVALTVTTVSSSGIPTFQIANVTDAVDMLSAKLTVDASETDSLTAATAAVIDTSHDDVATGDLLRIDCDVAGTGTRGAIVTMIFAP